MMCRRSAMTMLATAILVCSAPLAPAARADERSSDAFMTVTASDFIDWCDDTMCLRPAQDFQYDRVDGINYSIGLAYLNEEKLHPRLRAVRGWMSAREEGTYQIDFEQPIHNQDSFSFGIQFYDKTSWSREDGEAVSDFGNNLNAFIARADQRDYFRREGVTIFASLHATPDLTFRIEHRDDALSSLETKQSVWSVFGRDDDWRENPVLMVGIQDAATPFEGRMKSYVGSVVYDSRNRFAHAGWLGRAFLEFSGGSVGGDYSFRKYVLEIGRLGRISETQTLDVTASWGIGSGTAYPSHKLFRLGGPGNLRGYEHDSILGKNMMFARAEYGIDVWPDPYMKVIFFYDTGSAWDSGGDINGDFRHDFGIGFRTDAPSIGSIGIDVARAATSDDSDVFVYFDVYF